MYLHNQFSQIMRMNLRHILLNFLVLINFLSKSSALSHAHLNEGIEILASDDEVLQPLFERERTAFESYNKSPRTSLSKRSRKRLSFQSDSEIADFDENSLLKMCLDLPTFKPISHPASSVSKSSSLSSAGEKISKNSLKMSFDLPSIQDSSDRSSVKLAPGQQIYTKNEGKTEVIITSENSRNIQEDAAFKIPFSNIDPDDIEVIIYKSNTSKLAPGTVLTSPNIPTPGTVITTIYEKPVNSLTCSDFAINCFTESSLDSLTDNASTVPLISVVPLNANQSSNIYNVTENKKPAEVIVSSKSKKIKYIEDISTISLEFSPSYTGPKIDFETKINSTYVSSVIIPYFKSGKVLDRKSSYSILYRAYQEFLKEGSLHDINLEEGQNLLIFGDIHGQFPDFIKIVEKEGPPSEKLKYIFNGDIVDRGSYSIECLMTLLAFKIAEPENIYITLGNHETASVGKLQFHKESVKKYGNEEFFKLAHALFKSFPPAYLIQNEVFITHGGITSDMKLDRIRQINRIDPDVDDEDYINDLIWSDPVDKNGTTTSHRGLGFLFGPDATHEFIHQNNISVIIRSHQYKELGFSEQHDGMCITIFSCPKYRGKMPNYGAYIKLDSQLNLSYYPFTEAENKSKQTYPLIPPNLKMSRNVRRIR